MTKAKLLQLRVTDEEYEAFKETATHQKKSVSAWIRTTLHKAMVEAIGQPPVFEPPQNVITKPDTKAPRKRSVITKDEPARLMFPKDKWKS